MVASTLSATALGNCSGLKEPVKNFQRELLFGFNGSLDHYELLHENQRGTSIVWLNKSDWVKIPSSIKIDELAKFIHSLGAENDTYLSVNEFYGWRRTDLLKSLRANFVDLDFGRPVDQGDLDEALCVLLDAKMPSPNLVVFSGRGFHFYWLLMPSSPRSLGVWQAVENKLVETFKNFHADMGAKDCARVLRLVGTVNSKNNSQVHGFVFNDRPWTLHQLADEVLGERPKAEVKSFDRARSVKGVHPRALTPHRWSLVFSDLMAIAEFHGKIPVSHRNNWLFLCAVALSWFASPDSIFDEINGMLFRFCDTAGFSKKDAENACKSSIMRAKKSQRGETSRWRGQEVDPRYRYKRQTLYELLEPLAQPILTKLHAIIPDSERELRESIRQSKRNRSEEGRWRDKNTGKGHRVGNQDKVCIMKQMLSEGSNITQVAKKLGVDRKSVRRWKSL